MAQKEPYWTESRQHKRETYTSFSSGLSYGLAHLYSDVSAKILSESSPVQLNSILFDDVLFTGSDTTITLCTVKRDILIDYSKAD